MSHSTGPRSNRSGTKASRHGHWALQNDTLVRPAGHFGIGDQIGDLRLDRCPITRAPIAGRGVPPGCRTAPPKIQLAMTTSRRVRLPLASWAARRDAVPSSGPALAPTRSPPSARPEAPYSLAHPRLTEAPAVPWGLATGPLKSSAMVHEVRGLESPYSHQARWSPRKVQNP